MHALATHRAQLLHRIHRRYKTVTEDVRFGALHISFTRISDPDRVLDEVAAEADLLDRLHGTRADGDTLHLPYWAELWDSARGIGTWLVEHPGNPRSVLDLGCGMGMAGTVAAALGHRVLFADLESPALLFAQLNSFTWRNAVKTRRINWQRDRLAHRFDLILGADILYERQQWPWLDTFWKNHLEPQGEILLAEPGRQTGDLFIDWIADKGWRLEPGQVRVASRETPIRIFRLTLY